ncbi:PTTG1 interacting protein b isoform X2 [Hippoglossus stenolepis]|uniref:PTTG1 interacting protein b isoform X2 n=1 Tax=Hippoglossus stenolepis TaxID=195615 RepID=UPI00159C776D|nr:PTTG1 interacting protein b isoform X2 [Hippoglossus stenolepis]
MAAVCRALVAAAVLTLFGVFLGAEAQSPTPAPVPCAMRSNTSCAECLKNVTCLWCGPTQQCIDYPVRNLLPHRSMCPLDAARWGVCWVNFKVLMISMSVVAGVIIIIIGIICCCCCSRCQGVGSKREDATVERPTRMRNAGAQRCS